MIDIPKLIGELERGGDAWAVVEGKQDLSYLRDLCKRAAIALKEQHDGSTREVMHRLGLVLIELGKKLTGQG